MSALTWYELLGVDRDASPAEIKAAWRDATDKFEPGTGARQFSLFNEAADVLLDPERRAAYDAELAGEVVEIEPEPEPEIEPETETETETEPDVAEPGPEEGVEPAEEPARPGFFRRGVLGKAFGTLTSTLGLAILAVLTVTSLVLAVVLFARADLGERADIYRARIEAQSVAQRAMAVALSYNYQHLAQDKAAATSFMTADYAAKFSKPFDAISTGTGTSPSTAVAKKSVVVATVQATGVIGASADRVQLLVYVDQVVTDINTAPESVTLENRVIVTMVRSGGKWLIGELETRGTDCPECTAAAAQSTPTATPKP